MSTKRQHQPSQITDVPPEEMTPAVSHLLEICHQQQAQIQALRDEIARLKGGNPKPPIKPSKLEPNESAGSKRPGSGRGKYKRCKTHRLEIHDEIVVPPATPPPAGSRFKGTNDFIVQDLVIRAHNIRYQIE